MSSDQVAPVRVGIVGCGNVSFQYFEGCRRWEALDLVACADVDVERARAKAAEYAVANAYDPAALLADPNVELVINLTPANAHGDVSMAAIHAGKHVYSEKPLAATWDEAVGLVDAARAGGVLLGCAPDTFLGGGLQTCRNIVDDGVIGTPVAAVAFMTRHGYETWHEAVDGFYRRPGGGPALDIGPYGVTALVSLLGPARRVSGFARKTFPEREIRFGPRVGQRVTVEVPTHVAGTIEFLAGPIATFLVSWDIWVTHLPYIEIYGTDGSLSVPDPDSFGGVPAVRKPDWNDAQQDPPPPGALPWTALPHSHTTDVGRSIGAADMAMAIRTGRGHRANGDLGLHVLEILLAFERSSKTGETVELQTTCEQPSSLPLGLPPRQLDT